MDKEMELLLCSPRGEIDANEWTVDFRPTLSRGESQSQTLKSGYLRHELYTSAQRAQQL